MKLYLAPEIVKRFPEYVMFTVVAKGINNDQDCEELKTALAELEQAQAKTAPWRATRRRTRASPVGARPSATLARTPTSTRPRCRTWCR